MRTNHITLISKSLGNKALTITTEGQPSGHVHMRIEGLILPIAGLVDGMEAFKLATDLQIDALSCDNDLLQSRLNQYETMRAESEAFWRGSLGGRGRGL